VDIDPLRLKLLGHSFIGCKCQGKRTLDGDESDRNYQENALLMEVSPKATTPYVVGQKIFFV
jgi:hypothetical protein